MRRRIEALAVVDPLVRSPGRVKVGGASEASGSPTRQTFPLSGRPRVWIPPEPSQLDGGYILTPDDEQWIGASWRRRSEAAQRRACAAIRDGISPRRATRLVPNAEHIPALGPAEGIPLSRPRLSPILRAHYVYTETGLC